MKETPLLFSAERLWSKMIWLYVKLESLVSSMLLFVSAGGAQDSLCFAQWAFKAKLIVESSPKAWLHSSVNFYA